MIGEVGQRDGLAPGRSGTDDEAQLGLDVQAARRAEDDPAVGAASLADRASHVSAADNHGAGPAVIADGHVLPVRRQGVLARAEDPPDVRRVVLGGVEVDVVGDGERQAQLETVERAGERLDCLAVRLVGQPRRDQGAHLRPGRPAGREEAVERAVGEQVGVTGSQCGGWLG